MKLWRCDRGLLIERSPTATGVPGSLIALSKRAWDEPPADYWLVDDRGDVIAPFTVAVWSLDDELGGTLFAVEGDRLVEINVRDMWQGEDRYAEEVALAGLEPADDDLARAWARRAFERADALTAERKREGEARVAAIDGAHEDFGAGDDFRAAQRVLRKRIASYGESLSAALLRALVRFGRLYRGAPCVEPALAELVHACRRASFDRTLPSGEAPPRELVGLVAWSARDRAEAAALTGVLRELERTLEREADEQELADATSNAATLRAAQRETARARALLETLLAER